MEEDLKLKYYRDGYRDGYKDATETILKNQQNIQTFCPVCHIKMNDYYNGYNCAKMNCPNKFSTTYSGG